MYATEGWLASGVTTNDYVAHQNLHLAELLEDLSERQILGVKPQILNLYLINFPMEFKKYINIKII